MKKVIRAHDLGRPISEETGNGPKPMDKLVGKAIARPAYRDVNCRVIIDEVDFFADAKIAIGAPPIVRA